MTRPTQERRDATPPGGEALWKRHDLRCTFIRLTFVRGWETQDR